MSTSELESTVANFLKYFDKCKKKTEALKEQKAELKQNKKNLKTMVENLKKDNKRLREENEKLYEENLQLSITQVQIQHRGLAIICWHETFDHQALHLEKRIGAKNDAELMKNAWELYGCKVVEFVDKTSLFYDKELITEINNELANITDLRLFVFVLSTHGEEKEVVEKTHSPEHTIDHYFCTKDGELKTQNLFSKIGAMKQLEDKLKFFVIQACRSRRGDPSKNTDDGHTVAIDTQGSKPTTNIVAKVDAKVDASVFKDCAEPIELILLVPHCDDCIILFSSMAGKYAYRHGDGSVVIKALYNALKNKTTGDKDNIFEILRKVNSMVGQEDLTLEIKEEGKIKEKTIKAQSCVFHNMACKLDDLFLPP